MMNLKQKKQQEMQELFRQISIKEKAYLSHNKRFEILQFHWGIVSEPRTFRDINRLVGIRNAKDLYNEMIRYFIEKGHMPPETNCGIYFVRGVRLSDMVKIGQSISCKKRLAELQTGSPDKLYIEHVVPIEDKIRLKEYEDKLHAWFDKWRLHYEWFQGIPDEELEPLYKCRTMEDIDILLATNENRAGGFNKLSGNDDPLNDGEDGEGFNQEEVFEHEERVALENRGRKIIVI